jgi:hypothetical protein
MATLRGASRFAGVQLIAVIAAILFVLSPATVTAQDPADVGDWDPPFDLEVEAIHMIHLPTGKIAVWGYDDHRDPQLHAHARVFDPIAGTLTVSESSTAVFCSGHAHLADGRVLVAGGSRTGSVAAAFFDPFTETWSLAASMYAKRYYPTLTTLPNGRVLAAGGTGRGTRRPEIYDPDTGLWTQLGCDPTCGQADRPLRWYPRHTVAPDGRLFSIPSNRRDYPAVLDFSTETWTTHPIGPERSGRITGGPAAYFAPGKLLKAGGDHGNVAAATADAAVIEFSDTANPTYRTVAPMAFARTRNNLTLLPDGTILATGGKRRAPVPGGDGNVYAAELWDPVTETWTTLASMQQPRLYHSTATLLRDGRVLSAGGEPPRLTSAEIFSPPYLFRGPRPVITAAPSWIGYSWYGGPSFDVETPDAASVAQVNLLKLGAVTHAYDQSQRIVRLTFTAGADRVTVQAPFGPYYAAPGYYMLFLISDAGVPSVAEYVRVGMM